EDTNLFELSGVANTTDIAVSEEKVVTAANANIAEGTETVAVTGEYTLNLTDVTTEGTTEHTYKFSDVADNKATYVDTATTNAFWTKANDSKSYALTAEKVEDTNLFELSGVANTTDIAVTEITEDETVTGHKVVLTSANVATDAKEISLTGTNNVLELSGDDLPTAPVYGDTTNDFGDVDETAHTVKYIATTEGKNYWLQDTSDKNKYTLTKADDKEETLFTLSGVKSKEGITVDEDGTVTITSASLIDQDTPVTIDADGYKLAIGDGIDKVEDVPASYKDSVYSAKGKSAGYSVSSDGKTLSYSDTTVKSFTFEGVADDANDSSFYYTSGTTVTVGLTAVKTDGTTLTLKEASDGGDYALKFGKGMSAPEELPATYADNVYTTAGMSAGYNLSENAQSITYSNSDTKSFTFEGVADGAEASNFYLKDNVMTIGLAAVNTDGTTLTLKEASDGGEYTLKRGKGMTASTVYEDATYTASSMTYNTKGATAGYILSDDAKSITYNAEDTTTAFKFSGVAEGAEASNFYLKDNVMTIGLAAVNTDGTALTLTEVSDGGEYTLKRGKGMTAGYTYDKATYDADKMTYNTAGTVAGYALSEDAKSISYNAETTSTTFQFKGVADGAETSNFYLKDNVMTIGLAAVNTDGTALTLTNVSDGGEYTLKRGKGMTAGYTYDTATYNASNMTYNTAGTVAGYVLSDDAKSLSYNAETTATTFKFSGVADDAQTSNFYLKGNVMTIGQAAVKTDGTALKLTNVSDGEDYTLKLGKGMTAATVYDAATYTASSMTYNTKGATAGYALSSDAQSIAYNETATTTTFQFSGVADGAETSNFYLQDNVMTIGLAAVKTDGTALTLTNVSDGGEYTLKRGKGMTAAYTYDTATYDASKMTYNTAGTTAGYVLSDDAKSLSYNETATSDTFKFSGIADDVDETAFYVNAKNKTITIGKAAVRLDGTAVTLKNAPDDEYVLKLGKGMSEATTETQTALDSGTFSVNEVTEGYALSEDKKSIAYDSTAETALEITGVASEPTISDKQVAVTTATFDSTLTVTNNTGEYTFSVASGDYSGKTFTGSATADTVTSQGDNLSINTGAGNDYIKNSGLNVSINGGNGDDSILGGAGDEYFTGFNGNDYLHGGAGADTLNGGGGDDTLFGAAGDDSLNGGAGNDSMLGGNGNDQLLGGAGDDYLSGGAGNDVLRAGAGADTLWGGAGNDKLYGGDGEDTFIYRPNEGTDSIYNYTSGEDLLQIVDADGNEGTFTKSTFNSSKGTLALDIEGGGKVYFGGVTASDTFDINGKTYEISGSKLVEK
ncbi:MAG: hypothetical protein II902_07855, partial [Selenomonadaceae bacterium]|nr:hypothetical protein [Selenomonadaceae bacterium]